MRLESAIELCLTPVKVDTNFEGKLVRASINEMWNLANLNQST